MIDTIEAKDHQQLRGFLKNQGLIHPEMKLTTLHGDGSDRRFYRVHGPRNFVAVYPSLHHPKRKEEARSTYMIGYHLFDLGVAVPEVIAHHRDTGLVLFEDVGDVHLQAQVSRCQTSGEKTVLYKKAVDALLDFQIDGVQGFDVRSCWDGPRYDYELMVTRESDYFLSALCTDYAGRVFDEPRVKKECMAIANQACREPASFLLHRDYQSRNLMVHQGDIRIIDFQGARLGPLAYDLASLLFDPYVQLSPSERETIFKYYVKGASSRLSLDVEGFRQGYVYLAAQRVLQMLGAFGFLTVHRGKSFFEPFILPALGNLCGLLVQMPDTYPFLLALARDVEHGLQDCCRFSSPEILADKI